MGWAVNACYDKMYRLLKARFTLMYAYIPVWIICYTRIYVYQFTFQNDIKQKKYPKSLSTFMIANRLQHACAWGDIHPIGAPNTGDIPLSMTCCNMKPNPLQVAIPRAELTHPSLAARARQYKFTSVAIKKCAATHIRMQSGAISIMEKVVYVMKWEGGWEQEGRGMACKSRPSSAL